MGILGDMLERRREKKRLAEEAAETARKQAIEKKQQWDQVRARFPEDRFPVMLNSQEKLAPVISQLGIYEELAPNFHDYWPAEWSDIVEAYPEPPKSEDERVEREKGFWERELRACVTDKDDVAAFLHPKQEVMDVFYPNERWIFRWYYAATGEFHESFFTKELEELLTERLAAEIGVQQAKDRNFVGYVDGTRKLTLADWHDYNHKRLLETQGKFDGLKDRWRAHKEQWGNWYFMNVQKAFNEVYRAEKKPDLDGQQPAGPNKEPDTI